MFITLPKLKILLFGAVFSLYLLSAQPLVPDEGNWQLYSSANAELQIIEKLIDKKTKKKFLLSVNL